MARTIVYIDGFNLYYRALKGTAHKWLDVVAMSQAALPSGCVIERVNYYTARISGRTDPTAPARQHAYLQALGSLPLVQIHYGSFQVAQKWQAWCSLRSFGRRPLCRPAPRRKWPMSGKPRKRAPT